jgi:hypothetical protein
MHEFKKIIFRLRTDADGYPPVSHESVWGKNNGKDVYILDNLPYYIYGVSKGDTLLAKSIDSELCAIAVVLQGGHSLLRVFVEQPELKAKILQDLRGFGAICSPTSGLSLFPVDIPPQVNFKEIDQYLSECSDGEHIAYEDACLQHQGIEKKRLLDCVSLSTIPLRGD